MTKSNADIGYVEYFRFLDNLRESGVTNMFGAAPYIEQTFDVDSKTARTILSRWMDTFDGTDDIDKRASNAEQIDYAIENQIGPDGTSAFDVDGPTK